MNLEELVPPLELCKRIPAGEFEGTFAAYFKEWAEKDLEINGCKVLTITSVKPFQPFLIYSDLPTDEIREFVKERFPLALICKSVYPAPTLQEILVEIDNLGGWCPTAYRLQNQWTVDYQEDKEDGMNDVVEQTDLDNPAAAALKLWLKLKGIEDEQ